MNYKYATWILAVVAVVLAVMLFMKPAEQPVVNTFDDISERVTKCRTDLTQWNVRNPATGSTSPQAAAELEDIMEDCENAIKESQKDIGNEPMR
jgi:hypothetical protein